MRSARTDRSRPAIRNGQYPVMMSEKLNRSRVASGRLTPEAANRFSKVGTTKVMSAMIAPMVTSTIRLG